MSGMQIFAIGMAGLFLVYLVVELGWGGGDRKKGGPPADPSNSGGFGH